MSRWSDIPAWSTRTRSPSGQPQHFRCPDPDCPERATYPDNNPRRAAVCPLHHQYMNVEVEQ